MKKLSVILITTIAILILLTSTTISSQNSTADSVHLQAKSEQHQLESIEQETWQAIKSLYLQ